MSQHLHLFNVFGFAVASEIEFPELAGTAHSPDLHILLGRIGAAPAKVSGSRRVLLRPGAGTFEILNGDLIKVDPDPDGSLDTIRILLLGQMMAFLLEQRGWLSLHASGVLIGAGAALFVGHSGAGKSSTAAALHAAGYPLITDDVAALRVNGPRCLIRIGAPLLRLREDAATLLQRDRAEVVVRADKRTVRVSRPDMPREISVRRIYLLQSSENSGIIPLAAREAVVQLGIHSFAGRTPYSDYEVDCVRRHMQQCVSTAAAVEVRVLQRPGGFERIGESVAAVLADLGQGADG